MKRTPGYCGCPGDGGGVVGGGRCTGVGGWPGDDGRCVSGLGGRRRRDAPARSAALRAEGVHPTGRLRLLCPGGGHVADRLCGGGRRPRRCGRWGGGGGANRCTGTGAVLVSGNGGSSGQAGTSSCAARAGGTGIAGSVGGGSARQGGDGGSGGLGGAAARPPASLPITLPAGVGQGGTGAPGGAGGRGGHRGGPAPSPGSQAGINGTAGLSPAASGGDGGPGYVLITWWVAEGPGMRCGSVWTVCVAVSGDVVSGNTAGTGPQHSMPQVTRLPAGLMPCTASRRPDCLCAVLGRRGPVRLRGRTRRSAQLRRLVAVSSLAAACRSFRVGWARGCGLCRRAG